MISPTVSASHTRNDPSVHTRTVASFSSTVPTEARTIIATLQSRLPAQEQGMSSKKYWVDARCAYGEGAEAADR